MAPSRVRPPQWLSRISPALVVLVTLGAGFVVRPSPLWAMLFYLTVLPVCGLRLGQGAWPADAGSLTGVALILWFTLATAWDEAAGPGVGVHGLWLWNGLCTLVFFAAARAAFGGPGAARERLISVLIGGALLNTAIVFARTLLQGMADDRLAGWAETRHPILGASVIGTCVLLAASRLLQRRGRSLALAAVSAGLLFIVLTGSRGPLIAIAASLALLLALTRRRLLLAAGCAGVLALGLLAIAEPTLLQTAWSRLLERGWSNRLDIWQLAIREIEVRPLFGYGPSARLDRATDNFPHNLFLSTLFYSGGVGLLLLLGVLALGLRAAARQPDRIVRATSLALLLHLVLSGVSDLGQITKGPGPLWYIVWIPLVLALGRRSRSIRTR